MRIAEQIGAFVRDKPEIRNITIPLLGSGAGGLTPEQSARALILELERIEADDKVYNIFVFDSAVFDALRERFSVQSERGRKSNAHSFSRSQRSGDKSREGIRVFYQLHKNKY